MSELNINELPCEMLTKVFRFLDAVDLKNATLTCEPWNIVIESEFRWVLTLLCNRHGLTTQDSEQKMNFVLTTNREFKTIKIVKGCLSEDNQILNVFHKHGLNVVKLILDGCRMDNLTDLVELLNLTPKLKHAVVHYVNLDYAIDVPPDQVLPDLKKLTDLEMYGTDERIVQCFRKAKLTSLQIVEHGSYGPLVDFLSSQENLTSLSADNSLSSRSILVEMGKLKVPVPFRLMQLAIKGTSSIRTRNDHDNLLTLIESQAESLTELEIGMSIPSSVYECVFSSMTKLTTLSVTIDEIHRNNAFDHLEENCSVRTITLLQSGKGDTKFFPNLLKKLPNIRSVIVPGSKNKDTLVMAQNLSQFESLSVASIGGDSVDFVKFPNLRTLHIQDLRVKINWKEFTKIHSRLSELTIKRMTNLESSQSTVTSDDINQITTNVDLQTLKLGVGFVADDRFFEIIRANSTDLKVLVLHKSCISRGRPRPNVDIDGLRFCDDTECF